MSSIYRKGRDGYYYYQRYVFNKKTGKKDKKIYHSLNTKDYNKALKLKSELDFKNNAHSKEKWYLKNFYKILAILIVTLILMVINVNVVDKNNSNIETELKTEESISIDNSFKAEKVRIEIKSLNDTLMQEKSLIKENLVIDSLNVELVIPDYNVLKIENISGSFSQCRISVTISQRVNEMLLKEICKVVRNQNKNFSNIIICIYSDNEIGLALAEGNENKYNVKEKTDNWFVLYSYNSVEGEYFDTNPTGFLGGELD